MIIARSFVFLKGSPIDFIMKLLQLFLVFVSVSICTVSGSAQSYEQAFADAYAANSFVTPGILEAVAWNNTHMVHRDQSLESCSGMPQPYGIMGLFDDGENYFLENGAHVALFSGISVADQKNSPEQQIMAYAKAYHALMLGRAWDGANFGGINNGEDIYEVLKMLTEIPDSGAVNLLARDMQIYQYMRFLNDADHANTYGFQQHHISLEDVFGTDNHKILSANKILIGSNDIKNEKGDSYHAPVNKSNEYGPAIWNPAPTCNFSSRNGVAISAITIHTIQGSYAGAISWSQNCASNVSFHYVIRSSDGQVTQMVLEADKGWHVGSENPYTIGYEHEGFVDDPSWYTEAMYNSSADLSRDVINSGYGIPALRTYYGAASVGVDVLGNCTKIKGHQHYPNQTHTDPGINWDWEKYYQLINNNPTINTITSPNGSFYDTGGAGGNYQDDERELWLFQPPNAQSVTLDFTAFDLELDYDYLFIYDGDSLDDPVIGVYTGSNSPGTVQSTGGSLLVEFRSDCATTSPGWAVTYSSTIGDVNPPTTTIDAGPTWQTDDFNVSFTDVDGESGIDQRFYLIKEQAIGANDAFGNGSFGFASESFEDNASNWSNVTGTYTLSGNQFVFSDANEQNSNAFMLVDQLSSNAYLYEWDQTITSSSSNQRAGMHFFCDNPNLPNRGNSYFVYLRENDDKVQLYYVDNDVFTLVTDIPLTIQTGQSYNCKVTYDPSSGWINIYVDDAFVAGWQDPTPLTSGNSISLRTGGCEATFDNIRVYKSRQNQVTVSAGFGEEMGIESEGAVNTAYIRSLVLDNVGNWSTPSEEAYLLDFTEPTLDFLHDGNAQDIDTFTTTTLEANWNMTDIHSSIGEYEMAIGTLPNLDDILPWTSNGTNAVLSHLLTSPVNNEVYHVSVRAINGAGLSNQFTSNGQRYVANLGTGEIPFEDLLLFPNPADASVGLQGIDGPTQVFIYDINGKLCLERSVMAPASLAIQHLSSGSYRVIIQQGTAFTVRQLTIAR